MDKEAPKLCSSKIGRLQGGCMLRTKLGLVLSVLC
jgi:hypothetical protein